jgi:hypothetical protein
MKWFRGRLYHTRLEVIVTGSFVSPYPSQLLATARVKNVGLSKVPIKQKGSGLRILSAISIQPTADVLSIEWKHEGTFPVFEAHEWIESNETIEDQLMLTLPEAHPGTYRLELHIVSSSFSKSIVCSATGIANLEKDIQCD